jgi:hypothetical protein
MFQVSDVNKNRKNSFCQGETYVSDAASACFLLVSKLPTINHAAPPSIPLGFHPDRKQNQENRLRTTNSLHVILNVFSEAVVF